MTFGVPLMIQTLFGSVEKEPGLLDRLRKGVQKTRSGLLSGLEAVPYFPERLRLAAEGHRPDRAQSASVLVPLFLRALP